MITVFINSLTSGGAEKVVLNLLEAFSDSGKKAQLVCIENEQFYEVPQSITTTYLTRFRTLENSFLKFPYMFVCAWGLKRQVRKSNTRIVQSHLLRASFINVTSRLLGSGHHAQIVLHSRINFEHKPFIVKAFSKWVYRFVLRRADSVISICETMKRELDDYLDLKKHPVHLSIYNPHNLNALRKMALEPATEFSFSNSKKYLVSVGRIVKGKRIDDLINAFRIARKSHHELELIIIGDGPEKNNLEQLAGRLNMKEFVHFLGYRSNPFPFISKAEIMVLSSEWEGLPNIIIESMACGTAVISSDCISGPREILNPDSDLASQLKNRLEHGEYGLLYPIGKVDLLAEAIVQLLSDDALRLRFVQKGKERVKDFDIAKITGRYLNTFSTIQS